MDPLAQTGDVLLAEGTEGAQVAGLDGAGFAIALGEVAEGPPALGHDLEEHGEGEGRMTYIPYSHDMTYLHFLNLSSRARSAEGISEVQEPVLRAPRSEHHSPLAHPPRRVRLRPGNIFQNR